MNQEKIVITGFFSIILCFLVLFGVVINQYQTMKNEREKDKVIFIYENSLGCKKYRYNESVFWKCPKDLGVSQIESKSCTSKVSSCNIIQEPVL